MDPDLSLLQGIFGKYLLNTKTRLPSDIAEAEIRLDRNESAYEIKDEIKENVLRKITSITWKNYPPPYYTDLENTIADYCGVKKGQVVTASGSASIITTLLNYFTINNKQIVAAYPSFSLYEYHCSTYGIPLERWKLNADLEFDMSLLPELRPFSLVIFASPNNPTGNLIKTDDLINILHNYPNSFFIIDEVYHEFSGTSIQSLIDEYPNLLLLRSFSKTFSAAGLRIGYALGNHLIIEQIRKLILTFSLNYLSMQFVSTILSDKEYVSEIHSNIQKTIKERERVFLKLSELSRDYKKFTIKKSYGNFILIRFIADEFYTRFSDLLRKSHIILLDVSNIEVLRNSYRFTMGKLEENEKVIRLLMIV